MHTCRHTGAKGEASGEQTHRVTEGRTPRTHSQRSHVSAHVQSQWGRKVGAGPAVVSVGGVGAEQLESRASKRGGQMQRA